MNPEQKRIAEIIVGLLKICKRYPNRHLAQEICELKGVLANQIASQPVVGY